MSSVRKRLYFILNLNCSVERYDEKKVVRDT